jgi:acyl-[acyl-carrier-protein]-phospholipid O-acyltransferase / long-chain-fatty-acid--[acyl-carrier-protein] ligase
MNSARAQHASELMLPSEVVVLDKLPMLGSGKVDQLAIDKFVRDRSVQRLAETNADAAE